LESLWGNHSSPSTCAGSFSCSRLNQLVGAISQTGWPPPNKTRPPGEQARRTTSQCRVSAWNANTHSNDSALCGRRNFSKISPSRPHHQFKVKLKILSGSCWQPHSHTCAIARYHVCAKDKSGSLECGVTQTQPIEFHECVSGALLLINRSVESAPARNAGGRLARSYARRRRLIAASDQARMQSIGIYDHIAWTRCMANKRRWDCWASLFCPHHRFITRPPLVPLVTVCFAAPSC
jgi:hypothetical protein